MNIAHPSLLIAGCSILGYFLPEILVATCKVEVPWMMNVLTSVATGLITAALVA